MNIGFRMGRGHCVLDNDPRNGGAESLKALEAKYGPLPRTPKALTGGGEHYFFLDSFGLKKCVMAPGIDFQGEGSQVLAPPSIHKSGMAYKWELAPVGLEAGVEQVAFAPLPEWVRELAGGREPKARASSEGPGSGMPSATAFILPPASLSDAPDVGQGQRHAELLKLVGRELGRGESPEAVLASALEWNQKNEPPLQEQEVERQVEALARKEGRKAMAVQHTLFFLPTEAEGRGKVESGNMAPAPLPNFPRFHVSAGSSGSSFHFPPRGRGWCCSLSGLCPQPPSRSLPRASRLTGTGRGAAFGGR